MKELFDDPAVADLIARAIADADLLAQEIEKFLETFEKVVK